MSTPEFPDDKTNYVKDRLLRPLNPDSLPQELLGTRYLDRLVAIVEELQKPAEERSEKVLSSGLGYFSEHLTMGILNAYFHDHGINLRVEIASSVFDKLDEAVLPPEVEISLNGNQQSSLNGNQKSGKETVYLSEYNKTADLAIREIGGLMTFVDTTLSSRSRKLNILTPKARQVRQFEHPRLGKFAVFIVSLDRERLAWDETFQQVIEQMAQRNLDPKTFTVNKGNLLIGRFLDQLLFDIYKSMPEMDESGNIIKKKKESSSLSWDLVNVAGYFYSKLERIYRSLEWTPQYVGSV